MCSVVRIYFYYAHYGALFVYLRCVQLIYLSGLGSVDYVRGAWLEVSVFTPGLFTSM